MTTTEETAEELAEALDGFWLFVAGEGRRVHGQVADPDEVASVLLATLGRIAAEGRPDGPTTDAEASGEVPAAFADAGPETPLSDALHTLGEVQRMAESMVLSRNPMERECGRRVLAVIGPQGDMEKRSEEEP